MSYATSIDGALEFDPPLIYKHFADSPYYRASRDTFDRKDPAVEYDVEEWQEDTDHGTLTRRQATGIKPAYEDPMRAYEIDKELTELLAALPAGTTVTGYLEGHGANPTDLWRIYAVRDTSDSTWKPLKVTAQVIYPLSRYGLGDDVVIEGRS